MPACELVDVAVKVLGAHPVVDAVIPALEQAEERFQSLDVSIAAYVLSKIRCPTARRRRHRHRLRRQSRRRD